MDKEIYNPLIKTNLILSSLSIIGCLFIITLYICRKNLQSFIFSLIFHLSISEIINSLGNLLSLNKLYWNSSTVCTIQSMIIGYSDFCTLIWILIISYTIYDLMCNFNQDIVNKHKTFIIIAYSIPLVLTIVYIVLI
jgi:hypothetical protein